MSKVLVVLIAFIMSGMIWSGTWFGKITVGVFATLGLWYFFWPVIVFTILLFSWHCGERISRIYNFDYQFSEGNYVKAGYTSSAILAYLFILLFIQSTQVFDFLVFSQTYPYHLAWAIVGFVLMGIIWSGIELKLFARRESKCHQAMKENYFKHHPEDENGYISFLRSRQDKPEFITKKPLIFTWAVFWPFFALWFCINDPVKKIMEFFWALLKDFYRKIYESELKEKINDFKNSEQVK